jgi:hypothetical protein
VVTHNNSSTTYLTFKKLEDGLGNFVIQIIKAMAFTYYRGWNFLGVQGKLEISYRGNREDDILNFYFGNHVPLLTSRALFPNNTKVIALGASVHAQSSIVKFKTLKNVIYDLNTPRFELERYISKHYRGNTSLMHEFTKNKTNEYLSPAFLSHLRTNSLCGVNKALAMVKRNELDQESSSAITVVAHIRIGDVFLNDAFAYKKIPLHFYPLLFALIRKICPLCKLYAFTSVQHDTQLKSIHAFKLSLQKENVTLYIDKEVSSKSSTDEALNAIAHFSTADVFITAKSEFSMIAAYLNPNCVLFWPYGAHSPLQDWMVLPYAGPQRLTGLNAMKEMLSFV